MRINFLLPGYVWGPSGGFRVVYEYANRLVSRGHEVSVVHPRKLRHVLPARPTTTWQRMRKVWRWTHEQLSQPAIDWHPIDSRVKLLFVPSSDPAWIPDADLLFATGWTTVDSVLDCPPSKGRKCYLIQGYESYHAPKDAVDATWRAPLDKIAIAKWLMELGRELGCPDLTYIPNGVNHDLYRLTRPIEGRPRQISMLFSSTPIKGAADGIAALALVRERYPDLRVVFFGVSRLQSWVPKWVEYFRDPPQEFLIHEIYNNSRIYLAPSWTEGSPLPPAEAASCGCALVATDIGGFREMIVDGVTGLLSPPKNPQALAANICSLLENDDLRIRLASAAHSFASRLDWEHSTDLLEAFMKKHPDGARSTALVGDHLQVSACLDRSAE